MIDDLPSELEAEAQLRLVLQSDIFGKKPKLAPLLNLIAISTLTRRNLTEYQIGIDVFERSIDWVPDGNNSVVRVGLRNLKQLLAEYYATQGSDDLVIITINGRQTAFKYNPGSMLMPQWPRRTLGSGFFEALEHYFAIRGEPGLRCVVTGDEADWHHLDGDIHNNAIGNIIPLCERLRSHLSGLARGKKNSNLPELDPKRLGGHLAPQYFRAWHVGRAYGCSHLAFALGEPPYGDEQNPDLQIGRLGDTIYYLRHRFNHSILAYLIRNNLLPLLGRVDSIDPATACRLALQLSGLLDDAGYFDDAEALLTFVSSSPMTQFHEMLYSRGAINRFTMVRRKAQIILEKAPLDKSFDGLRQKAEEHVGGNANQELTLTSITTNRLLRQQLPDASKRVFSILEPIVDRYQASVFEGARIVKPPGIDVVNLAEMLILAAIATCRVQPSEWEEHATQLFERGKRLMDEGGYSLPPEFLDVVFNGTFRHNPKAERLLQLSPRYIKTSLPPYVRTHIITALKLLTRLPLLATPDTLIF